MQLTSGYVFFIVIVLRNKLFIAQAALDSLDFLNCLLTVSLRYLMCSTEVRLSLGLGYVFYGG